LSLTGRIDAEEKVNLAFAIPGKLTWVGVEEGDKVSKYQGIASLDQREVEKNIQKTLNNFMTVRHNFDQSLDDNDTYTEQAEVDDEEKMRRLINKSQLSLDNAVLDVEIQHLAKENSYLYAPIDGIVTKANHPYPGVNVSTSQVGFEIVNPATIYFSATADQADVVKLQEGDTGDITLDSFIEKTVPGVIEDISFTPVQGDVGTTYEIKIKFSSPDIDKYRLGMTGDIFFTVKELPNTIAIPSDYLQVDKEGNYFVTKLIKENGTEKLKDVSIKIGEEYEEGLEIKDGLKEGDIVYEPAS
jgi:RND family efflux transporter MFP subunit